MSPSANNARLLDTNEGSGTGETCRSNLKLSYEMIRGAGSIFELVPFGFVNIRISLDSVCMRRRTFRLDRTLLTRR